MFQNPCKSVRVTSVFLKSHTNHVKVMTYDVKRKELLSYNHIPANNRIFFKACKFPSCYAVAAAIMSACHLSQEYIDIYIEIANRPKHNYVKVIFIN